MKNENELEVYADWLEKPQLIGILYSSFLRGKQVYSFEYSGQWISDFQNICLDPDLYNGPGRQYVPEEKKIFGFLGDCLPDRWGRKLLKKKEEMLASLEHRSPRILTEYDFLTGINDESRMGGLRFRLPGQKDFIAVSDTYNVPPLENLRKLEQASLEFERTEFSDDKSLQLLLQPGSSLGGARPKATVKDSDNILWIAKFPSRHDSFNTGAWEKVTSDLARLAGLNIPETRKKDFTGNGSTFLTRRFDRNYIDGKTKRIHCASALTLLGKTDGADGSDGSSYLDIVEFIKSSSITPNKDLEELWNRIVFSILVSNTDDHLRNHNFILSEDGWQLAPLFDVNPNPLGKQLTLNISENNDTKHLSLALDTASFYNIPLDKAKQNIKNIYNVIQDNWKTLARNEGISEYEINVMKNAFEDKSVYQSISFLKNSEEEIKRGWLNDGKAISGKSEEDYDCSR